MNRRAAAAILGAVVLAAPPLAGWFSATMPRHLLLQVPALLILGVVAFRAGGPPGPRIRTDRDAPLLILAIGAMLFWMVPRSVDLAASTVAGDQMMHLSWFLVGAALARTLPHIAFPVKMALGIHAVAMLAALGLVYARYPGLLCTAYNMAQQRATGHALLYLAPTLGVGLWGWVIRGAIRAPAGAGPSPSS